MNSNLRQKDNIIHNSHSSLARNASSSLKTGNEAASQLYTDLKQRKKIKIYFDGNKYYVEHGTAYALKLVTTRAIMLDKPKLVEISDSIHAKLKANDTLEIEYIKNEQELNPLSTIVFDKKITSDIREAIDNMVNPIVIDLQATLDNYNVIGEGMAIVEVLPGMSIEQVAKAVCGQKYICTFNNFLIDGTKYQNPEHIVAAYQKNWEEGKKRFVQLKKFQEQIDTSMREQQISSLQKIDLISNRDLEGGGVKR